jgi:hypothetical protein
MTRAIHRWLLIRMSIGRSVRPSTQQLESLELMPIDSSLPMQEGRVVVELILPHVLAAIAAACRPNDYASQGRAALERTDQQTGCGIRRSLQATERLAREYAPRTRVAAHVVDASEYSFFVRIEV